MHIDKKIKKKLYQRANQKLLNILKKIIIFIFRQLIINFKSFEEFVHNQSSEYSSATIVLRNKIF